MNINETFRDLNVGLPEDILRHKLYGNFESAIRLIDARLEREDQPRCLKNCLIAQKEMMLRTPEDYPYTKEEALALLRSYIPDFSEDEFDQMVEKGKIGWIYLHGEMHFFNRFFETLCSTNAAFSARAGVISEDEINADTPRANLRDICRETMKAQGKMSVRFRIRAWVRLKEENFIPGMFLRVHLPIPASCEQQSDIRIEKVWPEHGQIAPEDALQRTVCWEETMIENHDFLVEYSYTQTAKYHDAATIVPDELQPDFCLEEEAPHIVFTPYIRQLVSTLTEGVTDPLEKARRFYDFITKNMNYNYMPAYFILENISETCARNFTGDCGVFALLFITLCRCAGIPAQWQSGLAATPYSLGGHDWASFYIAPYGWLYADPSYGVSAHREGKEERRQFYFGNLDPHRMVANSAFQQEFTIPKTQWRADPYDNQLGEMETDGKGFSFSEYERGKEILLCQELQ